MEMYLVYNQDIKLGEFRTIRILSDGHKKTAESIVRLNEESVKCLRKHVITEFGGNEGGKRSAGGRSNGKQRSEEIPNELVIQFTNVVSPSPPNKKGGMSLKMLPDQLEVKILGDILLDFRSLFGDAMRLSLEISNAEVSGEVDRQNQKLSGFSDEDNDGNVVQNLKKRITKKCRHLKNRQLSIVTPAPPLTASNAKEVYEKLEKSSSAQKMSMIFERGIAAHFCDHVKFPKQWMKHWQNDNLRDCHFTAKVSILFHLGKEFQAGKVEDCVENVYRKLYDDDLGDVEIVSKTEERVKCISFLLTTQSEVLKGLLESCKDLDESKRKEILMEDTSTAGVSALRAYMYCRDLKAAEQSCSIAVELFKAGAVQNLGILHLEVSMKNILLNQEIGWYDLDALIGLILFIGEKMANHHDLKFKAVKVLRTRGLKLNDSEVYNEMSVTDRAELCEAFLHFQCE